MKFYQSFILFSLFTLAFVSCNTDDLERDIDALKDRVASFETQVQQLNDEMNIIRVLLDGNKTITDYSIDGDTYTLTLSNGETLTLTPGVVGGNYPSIEIGENGNWFIGGEDTGKRAKAENGNDAEITPQFKIEANPADGDKKYWYVSYDEGKNWSVLENGCAEGTNTSENPIESAVVEGDNFKVVLSDGSEHFIPIVQGLECAINIPEGVTDGLWSVAGGSQSSFKVKVKLAEGDLVRVNAPADWNAKVSKYQVGDTEVTVTVTPPSTPSECIIVVEVTHGVNTATDQIKARTTSDSYWAEYQAGLDIKIGDVVINKFDYPDAVLLTDGGQIAGQGIYFIAENATVNWIGGNNNLIVLAEKKDNYPNVNIVVDKGIVYLGNTGNGSGLLFKGIRIYREGTAGNYWFNAKNTIDRLVFDQCRIDMTKDKGFSFRSSGGSIANMLVQSCYISVPAMSNTQGTINFWNCAAGTHSKIILRNNVFYCSTSDASVLLIMITAKDAATIGEVIVENNTLLNILCNHGTSSGTVKLTMEENWSMRNNLFWYDTDIIVETKDGKNGDLSTLMAKALVDNCLPYNTNKVFSALTETKLIWKYFREPSSIVGNAITVSTESPFVDGTLVDTEGKYTLKPEYQGIGATIE